MVRKTKKVFSVPLPDTTGWNIGILPSSQSSSSVSLSIDGTAAEAPEQAGVRPKRRNKCDSELKLWMQEESKRRDTRVWTVRDWRVQALTYWESLPELELPPLPNDNRDIDRAIARVGKSLGIKFAALPGK